MGELEVVTGKVFDVIGVADIAIAQMDAQYLNLKIKDVTDKEGYEAVHEGKMAYVHTRTKVEKKGLELRKKAKATIEDYLVAEKKEETRILNLLMPGEVRLTEEEKAYTDALETIRLEQIRQEELRIQTRRDRLVGLGIGFNGQIWSSLGMETPDLSIRLTDDEGFELIVAKYQAAINIEAQRIEAEQQKKREAEEKLARQTAAQEELRVKLEQDRLAFEAQQRRAAEEKVEWERRKKAELDAIEAAKQKAIKDEEDRRQKVIDDARRVEELETARKEAAEQAVRDLRASEEKERIAAERKAARQPDKVKILQVAKVLDEIQTPEVKTEDGKAVALWVMMEIQELIKEIKEKAGEL